MPEHDGYSDGDNYGDPWEITSFRKGTLHRNKTKTL